MNREIKFEYGFESVNGTVKKVYHLQEIPNIQQKCDVWNVLPIKYVRQYTGFKDIEGKEIYEGDILEYVSFKRDENKRTEVVEFDVASGGWYLHKQPSLLSDVLFQQHNQDWQMKQNFKPSLKHKVRIIGNIYENQELLKK